MSEWLTKDSRRPLPVLVNKKKNLTRQVHSETVLEIIEAVEIGATVAVGTTLTASTATSYLS